MKETESNPLGVLLLIVVVAFFAYSIGASSKNTEIEDLNMQVEGYQSALDESNANIEDAKLSAWQTYDEMGSALDNLSTVSP